MDRLYDTLGANYTGVRKPDARIAKTIERALGLASPILNLGAGSGSYEPVGRDLIAVEPSIEMIRKRGPIVVLTFDPTCRPWLTDYLLELVPLDEAELGRAAMRRCWRAKNMMQATVW